MAVHSHRVFTKKAKELRNKGARFVSLQVYSEKPGEYQLSYTFECKNKHRVLVTKTVEDGVPSLVSDFTTCDFPERQAYREFRIKFFGNPNLMVEDEFTSEEEALTEGEES